MPQQGVVVVKDRVTNSLNQYEYYQVLLERTVQRSKSFLCFLSIQECLGRSLSCVRIGWRFSDWPTWGLLIQYWCPHRPGFILWKEFRVAHSVIVCGRIPLRVHSLNPFSVTLQKYRWLAAVTSISLEDVRRDNNLALEEVSPGIVEVRIGVPLVVSTIDPSSVHGFLQSLLQQGVELIQ